MTEQSLVNGAASGEEHLAGDDLPIVVPTTIVKRDGRVVSFDVGRIENALTRCFASFGRRPHTHVAELAQRVVNIISVKAYNQSPTVEEVQDTVELVLQAAGEFEAAKRYILYRAEHAKQRQDRPIPEEVRLAFAESDRYFPSPLQKFQFFDKYSRFDYDKGRRETWIETVDRAVDFMHELAGDRLDSTVYQRIRTSILETRSMPSMRLLAMAGPAARRNNIAIYNCSYMPADSIDSFVEALIISMSGCGVGFSVESHYVEQLPRVLRQRAAEPIKFTVEDSAEGWADALRFGLTTWFEGGDVRFDLSELRPAGAPLRIKGGRASGPEPFRAMLDFVRGRILARQGSTLRSLDAHDIMCAVGNAAVSGGVRRCLPAGTRVHTMRGAIPIEEVREGDSVMTDKGYKPVTGWVDQGFQEILEIETESGTIFRCTPHHRVAVLTDVWGGHTFKYARELNEDDRLLFITNPIDGEMQPLLELPEKRDADHSGSVLVQPQLDVDTAWFLGKFLADGYVALSEHDEHGKGGNTQFAISCHNDELEQIERVSAWMEQHGIPARVVRGEGNWLNVRSGNRQIARWMAQYKQPNTPLAIPEPLWRSPQPIRAAFLAGLMDGDGSYGDRPVTVLSTVYETFGREVVTLLATLGIVAEIRQRRPETEAGWQALWIVTIKDALALQKAALLLGEYSCGTWIGRKGKQAGYTVPGWMVKRDLPRKDYAQLWPSSRDPNMNSATLTTLVDATHYVPVAIRALRSGGDAHTYDIEVRDGSMFVAEGYLVHNTAMISLFDYDDHDMRHAKDGDFDRENSQRWNANNSLVWPARGLTQLEIAQQVLEMVDSGRGEPGIFNRQGAIDMLPERRQPAEFGTNPCVTGDTWVLTDQGPQQVRNLIGVPHTTIVDGKPYATTEQGFWETGVKPVLKLTTKEGYSLRLTANHKVMAVPYISRKMERADWVEAGSLRPGDQIKLHAHRSIDWDGDGSWDEGWLLGSLLGDGTFDQKTAKLVYWGEQRSVMADKALQMLRDTTRVRADLQGYDQPDYDRVVIASAALRDLAADYGLHAQRATITPFIEATSSAFHRGFLQGWFDAEGLVSGTQRTGVSVRLAHSNLDTLHGIQRMLLRLGIVASVNTDGRTVEKYVLPHGDGELTRRDPHGNHELVIAHDNVQTFAETVGFSDPAQQARLGAKLAGLAQPLNSERFIVTIASIEPDGEEMVYDCSVPNINAFDANGLYVHNCGEIILRPYQFCNLTAAVARADDTFESLRDKVEVAAIIGSIQSMGTHFPGLRSMWQANCEEERLLGVDITGQLDSAAAQDPAIQRQLREIAVATNREYAAMLGINQSASVTCVKPSGNSSQLLDCASGLHARWAPYYIRNVRVSAHSPLYKVLRDASVPMDPENGQTRDNATTWVVHFPVKAPDGAVTRNQRTALEQCEYWLQNKLNWTEHNPSVTITYRPDEMLDLMKWIWEHREVIGGMAFLPAFDANYAQMPYVEISREEYERLAAEFPPIDFSKIYRYEEEDLTNAAQELACSSGTCEIDFI